MVEAIYQQILTHGILPKFREQAILIEDFLNDDEMIQDCILELPKYDVNLGSLNSARTQLLFKDIMHELLDTATLMQNLTLPFGTTSLEKFLFQRLKLLL